MGGHLQGRTHTKKVFLHALWLAVCMSPVFSKHTSVLMNTLCSQESKTVCHSVLSVHVQHLGALLSLFHVACEFLVFDAK